MKRCLIPRTIPVLFLMMLILTAHAAPLTLEQRRQRFIEGIQRYEERDYTRALPVFEALKEQYPELRDYVLFFLGHTAIKLKQNQQALETFQEFLALYPSHPLTYDVQINTAHLLFANNEYTAARDLYRRLLGHPDLDQGDIYYRLAKTFTALDRPREAIFSFNQMISFYPKHPARKQAQQQLNALIQANPALKPPQTEGTMLKQARAFVGAQWYKSARTQYEAIKTQYPNSTHMEECEFGIADGYFRSGQYETGIKTLEHIVKDYTSKDVNIAARALYTIGSKHWNADRNTQARNVMQHVIADYAQSSWADNAMYVIGRIYQGEKAYADAATWYLKGYADYPGSSFAEESLWRAGWCFYLHAEYAEATQAFEQGLQRFPDGSYVDDATYWLGRAQEQQEQYAEAINAYQRVLRTAPETYSGLRAAERLRVLEAPEPQPVPVNGAEPDMTQILVQLQQILPAPEYELIRPHLAKIFELQQVDLRRHAAKEADWLIGLIGDGADLFTTKDTRDDQLLLRYYNSRIYAAAGLYLKTIQWASALESTLKDEENHLFTYHIDTFPYRLDTIKYPLGYWELITTYAAANTLDPFLVAAIIRQESAYNPDAQSHADARGLMQVLPGTGKRLAARLNIQDFSDDRLYEPELNIKFGTAYVAEMLEKFDGNIYRAIAAYNAGPQATSKWWPEKGETDEEVIIENISYRETRNYVKRVLRDQYQYQRLYSDRERTPISKDSTP